jgi:hypothetical protein
MKNGLSVFRTDSYWIVAILFICIKLCLHLFTNTNYELHRDELLYFNMGDHLSFGYASVPPFIGFLAFAVKAITGYSVFGIRLIPALLGGASVYIIAKIIRELGGGIPALIMASSAYLLSPGFLLFDTLFTPNVVEQFLWLLLTYCLFQLILKNDPKRWVWIALVAGLAFLNKYSIVIVLIGFVIALTASPYRKLFISNYFLYSLLIFFTLILPNLLWQYSHNWPVLYHMNELKVTQLHILNYSDFFVDIFTLNSASTIIWLTGLTSLLFFKKESKYQCIGIASCIVIFLFFMMHGKGYYILGIIPFLFAYGGYTLEKYLKGKFFSVYYALFSLVMAASLIALPYGLPLLSFKQLNNYSKNNGNYVVYPFSRWEDGKQHPMPQVYADMTGWHELTGYVALAYHQLPEKVKNKCTILAERNYGYAGAVHFYGKEYGLPDAVTFLDSYTLWAPDSIPLGPVIYINSQIGEFNNMFHQITEIGCVKNKYFRENGLKVFLCMNPKIDIREVYKQKARKEKKIYQ